MKTTSYIMDRKKLIKELKTRATDVTCQGLWIERPPHLHGRPVLIHCPACILFLHCWSKLEKDVQLNFSIVTPTNTLAVTVHDL